MLLAIIIFLLGLFLSLGLAQVLRVNVSRAFALYLWHSLFCLIYFYYTSTGYNDAVAYFLAASAGECELYPGTKAIRAFTCVLVAANFTLATCFALFNIFGAIGLLFFDAALGHIKYSKALDRWTSLFIRLVPFLPSISFWSAALGKDALSFLSVSVMLWSVIRLNRRKYMFAAATVLMLVVRPHIASLVVLSLAVSAIFNRGVGGAQRVGIAILALIVAAALIPFALDYAGVGRQADIETLASYVQAKQSLNMGGGSSVDIASMTLPLQMFSYMFRPLPFEAHSVVAFLGSLDNCFLLVLTLFGLRSKHLLARHDGRAFMWIYALGTLIVLSLVTANLGIAIRQKWMFLPMFIYLFLSGTSRLRRTR